MRCTRVFTTLLTCAIPLSAAAGDAHLEVEVQLYETVQHRDRLGSCTLTAEEDGTHLDVSCHYELPSAPEAALVVWVEGAGMPRVHPIPGGPRGSEGRVNLLPSELAAVGEGLFEIRLTTAERPLGAAASMPVQAIFSADFESGETCSEWSATVNPERCNGIDDDCNGSIDDGNPGGGGACDTGLFGVCEAGTMTCESGSLQCVQDQVSSAEVCDGLDNNCNGSTDEGDPGGGASCSTGLLGVCAAGTTVCDSGGLVCVEDQQPSPEVCDGLDNNCNGSTDEGDPGGGASCSTGLLGVCAAGTTVCDNGGLACVQDQQPSPEVCDGLDNNCDGVVDEGCG